jgi:ATP-dependent DNA helicase RecQ
VRQLIHRGYLAQDIATFSVLKLTPAAARVLRGSETVLLARPRVKAKARRKAAGSVPGLETAADRALFEKLRELRKRLADERGVPPYVIFGDATLLEMSLRRPANDAELLDISGVGQVKLERHGSDFLAAIAATP